MKPYLLAFLAVVFLAAGLALGDRLAVALAVVVVFLAAGFFVVAMSFGSSILDGRPSWLEQRFPRTPSEENSLHDQRSCTL